ncbi:hypothetical protein C8J56DRAFT_1171464 [Mycena floridula]|nr:hypothetical protein C8J56DRAFT_1171464 [Mycena floridula]
MREAEKKVEYKVCPHLTREVILLTRLIIFLHRFLLLLFRCPRPNIISSSRLFAPIPPMVLFPFSLAFATIYVDVAMVKKKMKEANVLSFDIIASPVVFMTPESPTLPSTQARHIRDIVHEPTEL